MSNFVTVLLSVVVLIAVYHCMAQYSKKVPPLIFQEHRNSSCSNTAPFFSKYEFPSKKVIFYTTYQSNSVQISQSKCTCL